MAITALHEMWDIIDTHLPRDEWIPLRDIYTLIQGNIAVREDDLLPSAPTNDEPKWMRNVRNVLQQRKIAGDLAWDRNAKYMIPSSDIAVTDDSIIIYEQSKPRRAISEERFRAIQKTREEIGLAGEKWVVDYEVTELTRNGHDELARNVRRISSTNLSAGFDVISYELGGTEKFIEVKTTAMSKMEFFLSANELDVAKEFRNLYWIYFVSEIYGKPNLRKIHDPTNQIGRTLDLIPTSFRVQILE